MPPCQSQRISRLVRRATISVSSVMIFVVTAAVAAAAATATQDLEGPTSTTTSDNGYGVDVSFPIHNSVSTNYPWLPHNLNNTTKYLNHENDDDDIRHNGVPPRYIGQPLQTIGNREAFYATHLDNCRTAYASTNESSKCDYFEYERILLNRRQPQSMKNLTATGFQKVRAPKRLKTILDGFWSMNADKAKPEVWPAGNSYVNTWDDESPTRLVSVDDTTLRGSGWALKKELWSATSAVLEEFSQQELQPCSLYGIRVYSNGHYMAPHVDRLPLVVSAMINVAQDVDEPWPLEVYSHDGRAYNVTLDPGDMLLFESASVIHGHPFPLKGRYYASIFLHFEPSGRSYQQESDGHFRLKGSNGGSGRSKEQWDIQKAKEADKEYQEHIQAGLGGPSAGLKLGQLPPYILAGSPAEEQWRQLHPEGWTPPKEILPPSAHIAAKSGHLKELEKELDERRVEVLTERDEKGWQVLHQGVASGNEEVVKLLVSHGADVNSRTHGGYGESPLRIAEKFHGTSSKVYTYLKNMGALSIGPEL
mmetsp:Transcript_7041/g.17338  ORF Transcript_7041/g.17338 Transcript_7041/m.17338 type:complete len:534 (+) Transcript_7041:184-1785(+)